MRRIVLLLLTPILLLVLAACDTDDPETVALSESIPTVLPAPDLDQELERLDALNIGAVELLGALNIGDVSAADLDAGTATLASGTNDGTITITAIADGDTLNRYTAHDDAVRALTFNTGADAVASVDVDGVLVLYDLRGDAVEVETDLTDARLISVAISTNGDLIAAGDDDGMLYVWDVDDAALVLELEINISAISALQFIDTRVVAVGSRDGGVRVVDVDNPPVQQAAASNRINTNSPVGRINAIRAGQSIAAPATDEGEDDDKGIPAILQHDAAVTVLRVVNAPAIFSDPLLLSADFDGGVQFFSLTTNSDSLSDGSSLRAIALPGDGIRALPVSVGNDVLVLAFRRGLLNAFDYETQRLLAIQTLPRATLADTELVTADILNDGQWLVAVTRSGVVWVWGAQPGARPTFTPTATLTPSITPTPTASDTPTPTATPTPTDTPTEVPTETPTVTPSRTDTPEATDTPALSPTPDEDEDATATATTDDADVDDEVTPTPTATAAEDTDVTPTATSTRRPTNTPRPSRTPTASPTPTVSDAEPCNIFSPFGNVNIRAEPSTTAAIVGSLGDAAVLAIAQIDAADGFIWYQLEEIEGWVRSDVVGASGDCDLLPFSEAG